MQIKLPTTATAIDTKIPMICATNNLVSPKTSPFHLATPLMDVIPNNPVAIPPQIPPIPWQPKASNASSIFNFPLISLTPK